MSAQLEHVLETVHTLTVNELLAVQEAITFELRQKVVESTTPSAIEPLDWDTATAEAIIADARAGSSLM